MLRPELMTLSCSFLLNRDQAHCVRQHSTNTSICSINPPVCSEGNILEYFYHKRLKRKNKKHHSFGTPEASLYIIWLLFM